MRVRDAYPLVVTDRVADCRDFYVRLGFSIVFEASWFVYLASAGETPRGIAFMRRDHPSRPPGDAAFGGSGLLLTLEVEDAAAEHERLRGLGVPFAHPLTDEPWGQRRFALVDPAGVWIDVVQHVAPAEGFWEPYPPPAS